MKKYWKRCRLVKIGDSSNPNTIVTVGEGGHTPRNTVIRIYYKKGHIKNPVYRVETSM